MRLYMLHISSTMGLLGSSRLLKKPTADISRRI
jgi:hypothetical protein